MSARLQYEIQHAYSKTEQQELCNSLKEISDKASIPVVVFPETSVDFETFQLIGSSFRSLSADEFHRGFSGLQLAFIGHCGPNNREENGYNRVSVLFRGNLVWEQIKINSYNLDDEIISKNNLQRQLPKIGTGQVYTERLDLPAIPEINVVDTCYGRIMIAICEDLNHIEPSLATAVSAGVTHLIVPLLDKELKEGRWFHVN